MKKIYFLFITISIGLNVKAQLTLTKTNNQPVIGDVVLMADYDSTTAVPKATGTGMNWNYSSLTVASFTENLTYTTVASTPNASLFPTANIVLSRGGNNFEYYNNAASNIAYVGMADPSSTNVTVFSNPGTFLNWPTAFGNSNTDPFTATDSSPTYTDNWNGAISFTATGAGTVTMPNGVKHNNCLQVKTIITLTTTGSSSSTMTLINYEYYSSLLRYPILRLEYQTMKQGTVTNTGFNASVNTAALTGIGQNELSKANVTLYPNPAKDMINVQLPGNAIAEKIEMFDVTGRLVLSSENVNSLNTSSITKGIYLVKVKNGNSVTQKQIIITE